MNWWAVMERILRSKIMKCSELHFIEFPMDLCVFVFVVCFFVLFVCHQNRRIPFVCLSSMKNSIFLT